MSRISVTPAVREYGRGVDRTEGPRPRPRSSVEPTGRTDEKWTRLFIPTKGSREAVPEGSTSRTPYWEVGGGGTDLLLKERVDSVG